MFRVRWQCFTDFKPRGGQRIPTFRDALSGLWAHYDPAELTTPEAFARNPASGHVDLSLPARTGELLPRLAETDSGDA